MKSILKSLYLKAFPALERLGIHVTPVHHTQPIPDTGRLNPRVWTDRSELVGIDMREREQLERLALFRSAYRTEYDALARTKSVEDPARFYLDNPFFGSVDAEMLYCTIRHHRPRRILEIGSGFSTMLAAQALLANAADDGRLGLLDAYEPYPGAVLKRGYAGLHSLHVTRAEDIPLPEFQSLERNDVLFIDSSHVVKIGGDVTYEFLEVIPRLAPGVIVHVHDVFLPDEYPKEWILEHRLFWTEQYLLQAFLTFNTAFAVLWGASFMHARHPELLRAAFSSYDPASTRPGSFWMQRIA
jgi:predicted O-methyltransferase YrrM